MGKKSGPGLVTSANGSNKVVEAYGQDHSDVALKNTRRYDKMGGGTSYLGHSLSGTSAKQDAD